MSRRPRAPAKPKITPRADGHIIGGESGGTLSPVHDDRRGIGQDTAHTYFARTRLLGQSEIEAIYTDGLGRRMVELPIEHALSGWCVLDVGEQWRDAAEEVERRARELGVQAQITKSAIWALRDGWSLVLHGWSGEPPASTWGAVAPWRVGAGGYSEGDLLWIRPAYRWDCGSPRLYYGPSSPSFGQLRAIEVFRMRPDVETDTGYMQGSNLGLVHGSRFTRLSTSTGRSEYERVAQYLAQLLAGGGGIAGALARANVGVFEIEGWKEAAYRQGSAGYERVKAQFEALSTQTPLVLEAGHAAGRGKESFSLHSNSALGGTESALFALSWLAAGAAGIPMSVWFGLEPSGFASGEVQERLWLDRLDAERRKVEPAIQDIYDGLWAEVLGSPRIPEYGLVWPPVRRLTPEQAATTVQGLVTAAETAIGLGLTTVEAVRAGLAATPEADVWAWEGPPSPEPGTDPGAEIVDAPAPLPSEPPPPPPPPGTWLEADDAAERSGIAPRKIRALGARHLVARRKIGSRWEYRLEDVLRVAAESVEASADAADE
jgi:hypothetical protein